LHNIPVSGKKFSEAEGGKGSFIKRNCCRGISGHVRSWEEEGSSAPHEDLHGRR
jgi:hypothetical protein